MLHVTQGLSEVTVVGFPHPNNDDSLKTATHKHMP